MNTLAATTPRRYRVVARRAETADTMTLTLTPLDHPIERHRPGQFTMLTAFGIGEVPISISGHPNGDHALTQTIRAVGPVTDALCAAPVGDVVGVRGPYGTSWGVADAVNHDLLFVAGGLGLPPLRPAILEALANPRRFGRITVLAGARTPRDLVFADEVVRWGERAGVESALTVDHADAGWRGNVGLVTVLLDRVALDPVRTAAFVCGPEIMIRAVGRHLVDRGVSTAAIRVSLERNMRCGAGLCGHCQLGPLLLCRDGPVVELSEVASWLDTKEL